MLLEQSVQSVKALQHLAKEKEALHEALTEQACYLVITERLTLTLALTLAQTLTLTPTITPTATATLTPPLT